MMQEKELPPGWAWAALSEVCEKIQDGTHFSPKNQLAEGKYRYVTAKNIRPSGLDFSNVTYLNEEDHRAIYQRCDTRNGDVLLVKDGVNTGDAALNTVDEEISLLSSVCMLRPCDGHLRSEFLRYYLQSPTGAAFLTGKMTGTAIRRIILKRIKETPIPVAPASEQGRIVKCLDELLSDLDAGVSALKRAQANLKRYRAAVLKAAVTGELTAEWRAAHPNVEAATKLLARILAQPQHRTGNKVKTTFPTVVDGPRRSEVLDQSFSIPAGWCWARVDQLGRVQLGRQRSPKNRSDKYPTKYIRAANITARGLDLNDLLDMEFLPAEQETYRLRAGDIVVSEASGSPEQVGKPAIWNNEIPNCCFQNTVIRLRPEIVDSRYLLVVFRHCYINKLFARVAAGVGINHLSAAKFSSLTIPVPPLEEQEAIVSEVEQRESINESAGLLIHASLLRAGRLRQSILKEAFAGRLVPQDPCDEPASALLERIKQERAADQDASSNGCARARRKRKTERQIQESSE
jgi:type I restriction enzyme S subunit